jgi:kynurenine formamidase
MQMIDLSMTIAPAPHDHNVREVERWTHRSGPGRLGRAVAPFLAELAAREGISPAPTVDESCFPDGMFLGNEVVTLTVHGGTHMDAPFHYGPVSEGRPAKRIDDIPLEWCWGPGVRLTMTGLGPCEVITGEDVVAELRRIGHALQPGDIVLIETGWDVRWPEAEYFEAHPAMSVEATRYLIDHGVRVIGVDTCGFDLPAPVMVAAFGRSGDCSQLWPCHMFGREREYVQIERLGGLRQLPSATGFMVCCFPIRVEGAGAGWVRPVAFVP